MRESPALDIIHELSQKGAVVKYHDPHVASLMSHDGVEMTGVADMHEALGEADCAVIVTDHSVYDWNDIQKRSPLLIDTRRALARALPPREPNEVAPPPSSPEDVAAVQE